MMRAFILTVKKLGNRVASGFPLTLRNYCVQRGPRGMESPTYTMPSEIIAHAQVTTCWFVGAHVHNGGLQILQPIFQAVPICSTPSPKSSFSALTKQLSTGKIGSHAKHAQIN